MSASPSTLESSRQRPHLCRQCRDRFMAQAAAANSSSTSSVSGTSQSLTRANLEALSAREKGGENTRVRSGSQRDNELMLILVFDQCDLPNSSASLASWLDGKDDWLRYWISHGGQARDVGRGT